MQIIWLSLIVVAAVAVAFWRGVAIYRYTFHRKDM
jgi:hypothetical protein